MHITIFLENSNESIQIDISNELSLNDLKVFIEAETNIPTVSQILIYANRVLSDGKSTLHQIGVVENGLILLREEAGSQKKALESNDRNRPSNQPDHLNPSAFSRFSTPQWNTASSSLLNQRKITGSASGLSNEVKGNSNDPEIQAKMMELIRQKQVEENLQLAFDISPESFVPVNLLYIKLKINGHDTCALVDTGAQKTVLHPNLARKFGISNLIDTRFASLTVGVGSQHSEGRIHSVPVSLGDLNVELPCSFTILDIHVGILFGLDMLRRHKCSVDLQKDALVIGDQEIRFMTDYEIEKIVLPSQADIKTSQSPQDASPSTWKKHELPQPIRGDDKKNIVPENDFPNLFPEVSISKITSLGFTKEEAIEALRQTNGNVELAASLLF